MSGPLADIIRERIRKDGPVSFAWYMEQALYHPVYGYYSTDRTRIGRAGDFFTSVSVGSVFGELLAAQFVELFDLLAAPNPFRILEQGAETGQLAADILGALSGNAKVSDWKYWIIEPSAKNQAIQEEQIGKTAIPVTWASNLDELDPFTGVIFCNELLDALPSFLVEHNGETWTEICVTVHHDEFAFIPRPIQDVRLRQRVATLPRPATTPYRTEINLVAEEWVRSATRALSRGYILVVDYGFSAVEFYSPARTEGTLTGYRRHRRQEDVLHDLGEIDITTHVNFSAISDVARSEHCSVLGFTDQHHFMVGAAEQRLLEIERSIHRRPLSRDQQRFVREYKSLMHPQTMGLAFKYLLLGKGVTRLPSGFKHARDPATALQLRAAKV